MSRFVVARAWIPLLLATSACAQKAEPKKAEPQPLASAPAPVLVELFTSEGCSSCPPADDALAELEKKQPARGAQIIALGWHVDYWNRLGWADPYSSATATQRQDSYADTFKLSGVYTPQVVVDGQRQLVGGSDAVVDEIAEASRGRKAKVELSIAAPSANSVQIRAQVSGLPPVSANDRAELWLAITEGNLQTQVLRGENAGRRLKHTAVVRRLRRWAQVEPGAKELSVPASNEDLDPSWGRANLRATAFLQEQRSRRILGAATLSLEAR
jgi:hypothetical protein